MTRTAHILTALFVVVTSSGIAKAVQAQTDEEYWESGGDEDWERDSGRRRSSSGGGGGYSSRGPFGLGIILGDPTGFTGKYIFERSHGLQMHLGYGIGHGGHLRIVFDYIYHFVDAIPPLGNAGRLSPTVGIGAAIGVAEGGGNGRGNNSDHAHFGIRVPLGMSFMIRPAPIEVFFEVALGMNVVPGASVLVDGGIGGRWYF